MMGKETLKRPSELGIAIDPGVENALLKSLAVDRKKRYQDVQSMIIGLYTPKTPKKQVSLAAPTRTATKKAVPRTATATAAEKAAAARPAVTATKPAAAAKPAAAKPTARPASTATKPAAKGSGNIAVDRSAKGGAAKNNAPAPRKDGKTAGGLFSKLFKK